MATSTALTINKQYSEGNVRIVQGTIAVTYDGSNRTAAGETITHAGVDITTEEALKRAFNFHNEIISITCGIFKNAGATGCFVGEILPATAKVVTFGGGGGTAGDLLDDNEAAAPTSDTYTANFTALGV